MENSRVVIGSGILLSFLFGILLCVSFGDKKIEKIYIEVEKNVSVPCDEHNYFPVMQSHEEKVPVKKAMNTSILKATDEPQKEQKFVEEVSKGEYVLATAMESHGKYQISLVSTIPKDQMIEISSEYSPLPIVIHGKIWEDRKFLLKTIVDISKFANEIKLKVTKIKGSNSEEILADFLYGATAAGDYEMEISLEPLNVLYFNLIEEVNREIFKKPTKEKLDKTFENTNFLKR